LIFPEKEKKGGGKERGQIRTPSDHVVSGPEREGEKKKKGEEGKIVDCAFGIDLKEGGGRGGGDSLTRSLILPYLGLLRVHEREKRGKKEGEKSPITLVEGPREEEGLLLSLFLLLSSGGRGEKKRGTGGSLYEISPSLFFSLEKG